MGGSKQKTFHLLKVLTWEKFKLCLYERFRAHHLMLKNRMVVLEFTQGDGVKFFGSLCIKVLHKTKFCSHQAKVCNEVDFLM
jgi:hypothetical protein